MGVLDWVGRVGVLLLVSACASRNAPPARFPAEEIPIPEPAQSYTTAAKPEGAVGGPGAEALHSEVAKALAERGDTAQLDGALSAAASVALSEANRGHPVDLMAMEAAARRFGFAGVLVSIAVSDMGHRSRILEHVRELPENVPITRYGIRVSPSGYSAAVVYASTEVEYAPIARFFDPGQSVALKGEVGPRYAFAHVYLTKPDGTVSEQQMPGRTLDAAFTLDVPGKYQLEVMCDGSTGPVVISNVPLYVGIPEPSVVSVRGTTVSADQAETRMLALLNEARAAAGLSALTADTELRDVAMGHTEDMADHGFFGHVSPNTGTPEDRVRRSGALLAESGENIALAPTPELAHETLMNSPGHRANMLRPEFTHVGIAATTKGADLIVTLVFGRRPPVSALPTSAGQIETAIAALRAEKNLSAAMPDPIYRVAAQAGAEALAGGADASDSTKVLQAALEREVNRRRSSRAGGCVESIELLELAQLRNLAPLMQPNLGRFGVGAQMHADDKGMRLSTVILLEGVPCQVSAPNHDQR